jgi:hypothetical protein
MKNGQGEKQQMDESIAIFKGKTIEERFTVVVCHR